MCRGFITDLEFCKELDEGPGIGSFLFSGRSHAQIIEPDWRARKWITPDRSASSGSRGLIRENNLPVFRFRAALLPCLAFDLHALALFPDLNAKDGPAIAGPFKVFARHHFIAFENFNLFLSWRNLEFIAANPIQADCEGRKAPPLTGSKDAGTGAHAGWFSGAEQNPESIQRRAGQFQELVPTLFFDRKGSVEDEHVVGNFIEVGLLKIVFVREFCGLSRGSRHKTRTQNQN